MSLQLQMELGTYYSMKTNLQMIRHGEIVLSLLHNKYSITCPSDYGLNRILWDALCAVKS